MKCKRFIIYHLAFIIFFTSCDIVNSEEGIPTFLEVNTFQLTTNTQTQGSDQHQINDVWAFVGGEALGVFELPAIIPVLAEGEQTITLLAGIRQNGLRSAAVVYPFYERYEQIVNLKGGETLSISPSINYNGNSIFELIEDFETNATKLTGGIQRITEINKVKEGTGTGSILLTASETTINSSVTFLNLPTSGGLPVFLEMDYRTNVELEVGLAGLTGTNRSVNYKVTLCPIDQWNKVYINFQEDLEISQLDRYQLAFRVSTNDTGCGNVDSNNPEILLDNIKLIRFQP